MRRFTWNPVCGTKPSRLRSAGSRCDPAEPLSEPLSTTTSSGASSRRARLALTGHMNDCRGLSRASLRQQPAGLLGRDGNDLHASSLGLLVQLRHDGKLATGAGADDQPWGRPGDLLVDRQGCMTVSITVRLRRLLLPTAHVVTLEDDVAVEPASVDLDQSEADELGVHVGRLTRMHATARRKSRR
jgi:hypothetical protein